jgi:hypothetical protein
MAFTSEHLESERSERRKAGRITCAQTTCQFGDVKNMSKDGCRVVSKKPLELPEGKTVNLKVKAMGASIVVPVRLVSCRARPDGRHECGFQFMELTDESRREIMAFARSAADNEALRDRRAA